MTLSILRRLERLERRERKLPVVHFFDADHEDYAAALAEARDAKHRGGLVVVVHGPRSKPWAELAADLEGEG